MDKREVFVNITKSSTQKKKAAVSCLPIYVYSAFSALIFSRSG